MLSLLVAPVAVIPTSTSATAQVYCRTYVWHMGNRTCWRRVCWREAPRYAEPPPVYRYTPPAPTYRPPQQQYAISPSP
jgi:hypothetical protein